MHLMYCYLQGRLVAARKHVAEYRFDAPETLAIRFNVPFAAMAISNALRSSGSAARSNSGLQLPRSLAKSTLVSRAADLTRVMTRGANSKESSVLYRLPISHHASAYTIRVKPILRLSLQRAVTSGRRDPECSASCPGNVLRYRNARL
jgi:hypothetical protein